MATTTSKNRTWVGCLVLAVLVAMPAVAGQEKEKEKTKTNPPAGGGGSGGTKSEKKAATLKFKLRADATLEVDDTDMGMFGETERTFKTPPLEANRKYYYIARAIWEPNNYTRITRSRKVYVRGGETAVVDLLKADPKQPDDIFVRYVPTPQKVVDAMLKLGKVGKDDVVYDLGCGDGRIVVTAVSKFGAKRGVGVDRDPERIKDSKKNAADADVEKKVELREADVLKVADLEKATVVCLYLGEDLNRQLRPLLQKQLKPGSRIVSHRFTMGDWQPDRTETVIVNEVVYKLHLWTVKKDAQGQGGKAADQP